ncbi:hypothetical protein GCM10022236_31580 [Microlunatus ginsengisoli]|uniref:Uncharacterized protein n=1 Tax=Microlunatus ginsengisoli TaxID=363863 RepID=A0ABP7A8I0_9ACTN
MKHAETKCSSCFSRKTEVAVSVEAGYLAAPPASVPRRRWIQTRGTRIWARNAPYSHSQNRSGAQPASTTSR